MISPNEYGTPVGISAVIPLAALGRGEKETIASFLALTDVVAAVGGLVVNYGDGKPLSAFQAVLRMYQLLLRTEQRLRLRVEAILDRLGFEFCVE
jgi:hypothetical protein